MARSPLSMWARRIRQQCSSRDPKTDKVDCILGDNCPPWATPGGPWWCEAWCPAKDPDPIRAQQALDEDRRRRRPNAPR